MIILVFKIINRKMKNVSTHLYQGLFLPILFLSFFANVAYTQSQDTIFHLLDQGLNNANFIAMDSYLTTARKPKLVEGSLYLNERWSESLLLTHTDQVVPVPARYRIYDDQIQILHNGKEMKLFPDSIKAIKIGKRVFLPLSYTKGRKKQQ